MGNKNGSFVLRELNPELSFELAGNDNPLTKLSFVAYTGKPVSLKTAFFPVIFDLSSTKGSTNIPLLYAHNHDIIIGHVQKLDILKSSVKGKGVISNPENERSKEIVASSNNGFPWQLSIGVASDELDFIDYEMSGEVNGKKWNGPLIVAKENLIREVSILPVGADTDTLATISASFYGGIKMNFETWLKSKGFVLPELNDDQKKFLQCQYDEEQKRLQSGNNDPPISSPVIDVTTEVNRLRTATADERTRIDSINSMAVRYDNPVRVTNGQHEYIATVAIREGWNLDRTEIVMLQSSRPSNVQMGGGNETQFNCELIDAAISQAGKLPNIEKRFKPELLEAAHKHYRSRIGLHEFLLEAARAGGYRGRMHIHTDNLREVLQAAFSTINLPGLLATNANRFLLEGYNQVDNSWRTIARIASFSDFKETSSYRGVGGFTFEKIAPDGKIPHAAMTEEMFTNKIDTFAKMFALTRQDIINDDLGAMTDVPRRLGRGGALGLARAVWVEFLNNAAFFAAGNNNVSTGVFGIPGLDAANAVFRKLKDSEGNYLLNMPRILAVPEELRPQADQLLSSINLITGESKTMGDANYWANKLQIVSSPYMSDSTITGSSAVAYYLLADPNDVATIEVAFLDGIEVPTVETAETDFNTLGVQWRGYWDWGTRKQDPKGGVRSTGA